MNAVLMFLIDVGTQLAQRFQVEINRTTANIASAESRNERLTQTVQQRAGEQNRNTRRTRQRIHVGHIGKLHIRGVDRDHAVIAIHRNVHAMQTQQVGDTCTSRISGTFFNTDVPGASSAATMALLTKFFAPRTLMVPFSGLPPSTCRMSLLLSDTLNLFRFPYTVQA